MPLEMPLLRDIRMVADTVVRPFHGRVEVPERSSPEYVMTQVWCRRACHSHLSLHLHAAAAGRGRFRTILHLNSWRNVADGGGSPSAPPPKSPPSSASSSSGSAALAAALEPGPGDACPPISGVPSAPPAPFPGPGDLWALPGGLFPRIMNFMRITSLDSPLGPAGDLPLADADASPTGLAICPSPCLSFFPFLFFFLLE
eukprot:CAMPEP_0118985658 /NCGR_PEP_ID=MMETSP1173-20130426/40523_1 /TAXON_ID=1034831 /ORGANISM="Rhizochromulina marina cf, Strain CCMP1243" /LENGTH=199 /DNA_ID=CAMNT_0006936395 /DNA_START=444 /DNA_END=1041 /DNA_ORIENTATION=+